MRDHSKFCEFLNRTCSQAEIDLLRDNYLANEREGMLETFEAMFLRAWNMLTPEQQTIWHLRAGHYERSMFAEMKGAITKGAKATEQ